MRLFSLMLLCLFTVAANAQSYNLQLDDGTKLYLEKSGEGQAMVFIPGWTMTSRFFERQKEHFSKAYQVITYDPRGQGRSDKTASKNTYADHAHDLQQLIQQHNLNDIVLVGWSSGCLTMYEYIRLHGLEKIQKLVFIDEPPKWIGNPDEEWVYGSFDNYRSSLKSLIAEPSDTNGIINWMLKKPIDDATRKWMNEEMKMTPSHVATSLYIDGVASDYTAELDKITVPAFFMLRSSWREKAESWLKKKNPEFEVTPISSHAMFWEEADQFNTLLANFLNSN